MIQLQNQWLACCSQAEALEISVFMQPWWLDIVCGARENWELCLVINKLDQVIGAVVWQKIKIKGVVTVGIPPPITPVCGIWIRKGVQQSNLTRLSYERGVVTQLAAQMPVLPLLELRWTPESTDWFPFFLQQWHCTPYYTYRIDLNLSKEQILDNFHKKLKTLIADAPPITFLPTTDFKACFGLIQQTFARQALALPLSEKLLLQIMEAAHQRGLGRFLAAYDDKEELSAFVFWIKDGATAWLLLSGSSEASRKLLLKKRITWQLILDAKAAGCRILDFEGSMLPGVESLNRDFGGVQTPYFRLTKYSSRWMKLLFALNGKR